MGTRSISLLLILVAGNLALFAAPVVAGGSCSMGPFEDQRTTEIKVTDLCFSPTVARVEVGDTVTFFNGEGGIQHMVGGMAGSFGDLHTELSPGETLSYRFDEEGVFPYACILHPGMGGAIVVGDGEGKVASGGVTEVGRPAAGDGGENGEARSTATSPTEGEADRSWALPAVTALALVALGLAVAWARGLSRGVAGSAPPG